MVYRVKGIDLRVGRCKFSGFRFRLEGIRLRVWRLIDRDTFVGL